MRTVSIRCQFRLPRLQISSSLSLSLAFESGGVIEMYLESGLVCHMLLLRSLNHMLRLFTHTHPLSEGLEIIVVKFNDTFHHHHHFIIGILDFVGQMERAPTKKKITPRCFKTKKPHAVVIFKTHPQRIPNIRTSTTAIELKMNNWHLAVCF